MLLVKLYSFKFHLLPKGNDFVRHWNEALPVRVSLFRRFQVESAPQTAPSAGHAWRPHAIQQTFPVHLKYMWQTWRLTDTEGGGSSPTRPEPHSLDTLSYPECAPRGATAEEKVHRHYLKSNGQMLAERLLHSAHWRPEPPTASALSETPKLGRWIAVMSGQPRFVNPFYRPQCLAAAAAAPAGKAKLTHPGKAILAGRKVGLLA